MKKLVILSLLLFIAGSVSAQQLYNYTQYNRNIIAYNPAFTGMEGFLDVNGSWRKQWDGHRQAPEIFTLSAHGRFKEDNKYDRKPPYSLRVSDPDLYDRLESDSAWQSYSPHAVGGYIIADRHEINDYSLFGSYAYHLRLSSDWTAAAGVSVGVENTRLAEDYYALDPSDPIVIAISQLDSETRFDFNVGLAFYSNRFFVGYAATQLSQQDVFEYEAQYPNGEVVSGELLEMKVHHMFNLGYRMRVSPAVEFYPNAMVRYVDGSPISVDATTKFRFSDLIMVGATWRWDVNELDDENIAIAGMVGASLDKWNFSYSYDYPLNELQNTSNGTHEVTVGLSLYKLYDHPANFLW